MKTEFVRDAAAEETPRAEWGSLTGWEVIVFQLDDEPDPEPPNAPD